MADPAPETEGARAAALAAITQLTSLDESEAVPEAELRQRSGDDAGADEAPWAEGTPGAMELLQQAMRSLRIEGCMGELDGGHRQSLALAYYHGLTHQEVAAQMGAPLGSVTSLRSQSGPTIDGVHASFSYWTPFGANQATNRSLPSARSR